MSLRLYHSSPDPIQNQPRIIRDATSIISVVIMEYPNFKIVANVLPTLHL
jgi:hypothetical protein